MIWTQRYRQAYCEFTKAKAPRFYEISGGSNMIIKFPKVTSSNGLRRAIINFCIWSGHHLEATNTMGRPIEKTMPKFNIMDGKVHNVPNGIEWQKGSGTLGSSDAKGHISHSAHKFAVPLYVEIKYGKDRMSDDQKKYEKTVNSTGGIYLIAKNIDQWFIDYDKLMVTLGE